MRVALYTRVSGPNQKADLQLDELREYAAGHRWEIVETFQDVAGGKKAKRSGLERLMTDARRRKFVCVLVWKLDRFGRSLPHCLYNL